MWKRLICNPATCSFENGKYLASVIEDSVITSDKILEETETVATNFNLKIAICETKKNLYFSCFFINYHFIIDDLLVFTVAW